ncbi:translation initiation factor IF-2 [Paenibacillus periandrae]|uniref:translation initiation factor IF-2 n=1 Tax=Paenibacillus periandrae TaxID=1761741 RepID=UPI001F0940EA|nr:translation initiation factor IF-2 [Paenibacillus periandrae]
MVLERNLYTLGKAAEHLEREKGITIPIVTLRKWFDELERLKVHTLPRTENKRERVLSQLELDIAIYIQEFRQQYGRKISIEIIAEAVKSNFETNYYEPVVPVPESTELVSMEQILERINSDIADRMDLIREEIRQEYEEKEMNAKLLLPDPVKKAAEDRIAMRTFQLNIWDTERKIRKELTIEAEGKWHENPIKTGFIIKKEDIGKKMEFVKNYVEEHLDDRLKLALDINTSSLD